MQFKMLKIMNDVIESQMISILTALVARHTGAVGLPTGEACPSLEDIHVWNTRRCWFRFFNKVYIKTSLLIYRWINLASITNILPGKFALSWDFKYPGMNSVWKNTLWLFSGLKRELLFGRIGQVDFLAMQVTLHSLLATGKGPC